MELLSPRHPPGPAGDSFSGFSPPASFQHEFDRTSRTVTSQLPEIVEEGRCRSTRGGREVGRQSCCFAPVDFPEIRRRRDLHSSCSSAFSLDSHSPSILPNLMIAFVGKLPASQASSEVVSAYRKEEREQMRKLLVNYLGICYQSKVKASVIVTEASQVQKEIVDLVNKRGIRKLVMGAVPENCMKVKKSSSKASYAAKKAPQFCEIWFVNKGKHMWTREAFEGPRPLEPISPRETGTADNLRSKSLQCHKKELISHPECLRSSSASAGNRYWVHAGAVQTEVALTSSLPNSINISDPHYFLSFSSPTSTSSSSGYTSSAGQRVSSDSSTNVDEESLHAQLTEIRIEVKASRDEAFPEFLKRKNLETRAVEAISKVKALESAHAHEIKLRKDAEDALKMTIQEQEKLLEEREEVTRELHMAMRNIALLDSRAQEANRRREEAAGELELIQTSIAALQHEKQKIRRQKMEATHWLDRWKSRGQAGGGANYIGLFGFNEDSSELAEFSLADLQTATCNFSESFKIGQSGYGCVYKGEMLDRTVAIKKLNPHTMQRQSEFQQEVQVLGKLRHPHLVTLFGVCSEAWSLILEYMPSGNLQDRLFRRSNICSLTWKIRVRIIAEISSALLFLHSFKPEKIVHGDLKPENILLDSNLNCKLCDFGICRLMPGETLRCPSFRRYTEPKGAFSYTDPEVHRTGSLTPKSDVYSFGLIILQLLTGRTPVGLAGEVRKAVSCGKLVSILDSSAGEWPNHVSKQLVDLGLQCCELNSRDRPELTPSLVRELEQLHTSEELPVPSFFLCPILKEIMHDPQVAADGFTYEGDALRGWLENGRETSPMTNLRLDHLHLTPNHALRLAIQDWLCKV
ncbi:hypothetical protein HYC85_031745 [Camellia sinensis]|uniref:RING-type E3 ubiquitin transferase n=1 Tax=Camellia sinensis TaxID=4442 RepID=A0A7J7FRG6_CAMSI|nr:hypothetical protein HYC85_031745 [Camellia sinensis]